MIQITFRVPDNIVKKAKLLATEKGIKDAEMFRLLMARGLEAENILSTKLLLESLCLNRRIAANIDVELVEKARQDAQYMLEQISNSDS